jgi:orotidine-5'-phosphate decarboxylase
MLEHAVEAAGDRLKILGVTLLTSLGAEDLPAVCISGEPPAIVERRAALAAASGCGGVVCSPRELGLVRPAVGEKLSIITPGIRPAGAAMGDQKRAATPASAIGDGADYLVVGRPIRAAADPAAAAAEIVAQIGAALEAR